MRVAPAVFAVLFTLVSHLPVSARSACADAPLRLNEFMAGPTRDWDGSGAFSSRDDEWVEVLNTGATPLDLAGFVITDGDTLPRFALSGTLAGGARRLVFGKESFDWEHANGFPAFGFSLGNSGDKVMLWQVAGAETLLVDSYTYKSHEAAADRAVGRSPDGGGWALFDALNPYVGTLLPAGNGCAPTPGLANVCDSTPATTTTWGELKTRYR
jgi:Lamin Tail Domain